MLASITSQAGVITVSGNSFNDQGNTTVDLQTGLEWLDIKSDTRSQCSVYKDIGGAIPAGCNTFDNLNEYNNADNWRYATRAEFASLASNWTGLTIPSNGSASINSSLAQLFIQTFGVAGSTFLRADFAFDHPTNTAQALGFYLADTGVINTNYYNGNINSSGYAPLLVRGASVPESNTLALMMLGLMALVWGRRIKQ